MIGQVIQYLLYAAFWLTLGVAGAAFWLTWLNRKGTRVSVDGMLGTLALLAAVTPYVGLFGTVWHIIQSLAGIGSGNLNVAAIAQPIGQALYATLWGLASAIPALIAHRAVLLLLPDDDGTETLNPSQE